VLAGLTVSDAVYTGASSYAGSAIYGNKAFAELDHLRIVNNNRNTGGGAVTLVGAEAYIHDCIFRDNKGTNAGVALHMRDNGKTIVARCEFSDNEATANNPQYGGALALADNGGTLYMANNTITGSHIYCAGAGIRAGGNTTFYSMFNTWFDNTCNFATRYSGAVISVGTGARFHSMADIVVNEDEGKADNGTNSFAHVFIQAASNEFHSGGHNIWTSVTNNSETGKFHDTDNINMAHTIASVFGENSYTDFGYSRVIVPLESYRTVPVDDIAAKAAEWNLPAQLDVTLDQAGNKRTAMTVPGAFDVSNFITTGIADAAAADRFTVLALGAKRFAVEGVEGAVAVYDLSGRKVSAGVVSAGSVLDLNGLASGIYILYADGKSAKIAI
ncbi:MAG: T9SS type A sorting domain-containing protein, partial [Muribaculaceae bacterium]|nr:T9SS type A sorting domain-containing protein [Muribaculaceae bacterium]